ncbi:hypothetical protein PO883_00125 [Massilia sp. DJPM01]|uniref:hypothetical protein n=1 Tax=Massilia sp. DJPM01 TaxID=3024404 RepID=UPI00259D4E68|nr:hypothetical protein [Massilia sp. DJPM01]MDM5175617.1 hypothetical protein [Massilia sp. DJPM01]
MNKTLLLNEFSKIQDDDSWYEFEKRHFEILRDVPSKDLDEIDREYRRKPFILNGILWKPVPKCDLINEDIKFLHWKLRHEIFARLDPEAAAENAAHPERYERWCLYCGICTKEISITTCPICEHELLNLPLNDK